MQIRCCYTTSIRERFPGTPLPIFPATATRALSLADSPEPPPHKSFPSRPRRCYSCSVELSLCGVARFAPKPGEMAEKLLVYRISDEEERVVALKAWFPAKEALPLLRRAWKWVEGAG